jgi:glc operon protein GlcG
MRLELAYKIATAVLAEAERRGACVSVALVDESGHSVLSARMDGARFITPTIAYGKAYASAAFRSRGSSLQGQASQNQVFFESASLASPQPIVIGGGSLPLFDRTKFLGAIGISGSSPELDEAIATYAAETSGLFCEPTNGT